MAESFNKNQQHDLVNELELWKFLPSDIFPPDQQPEVYPRRQHRPNNSNFDNHRHHLNSEYYDRSAFCMAGQQGLASFSLIQGGPTQQPPQSFNLVPPAPNLEMLRMANRRPSPGPLPQCFCCLSGGCRAGNTPVYQQGAGTVWPGLGPGNPYQPRNPVQIQAECFMEERARALQAMQYRSWMNRVTKTRVLPERGCGGAAGGRVGFLGGTGVYLPRIPADISSTAAANRGRRQGARAREENEEAQKKKKEEGSAELEVGLPEEWTY